MHSLCGGQALQGKSPETLSEAIVRTRQSDKARNLRRRGRSDCPAGQGGIWSGVKSLPGRPRPGPAPKAETGEFKARTVPNAPTAGIFGTGPSGRRGNRIGIFGLVPEHFDRVFPNCESRPNSRLRPGRSLELRPKPPEATLPRD